MEAGDAPAPLGFAAAVMARVNLMYGSPSSSLTPGTTFAALQSSISGLATSSAYVNPSTGTVWDLPTLLTAASGQSAWLPDSAGVTAQEQQITAVLGAMGWRLAGTPQFQAVTQTSPLVYVAANSCTVDPTTGQQVPPPSLVTQWQGLYAQAISGAFYPGDAMLGAEGEEFSGAGAQVLVGRGVVNAVLPQGSQTGAPIPGVAVDGARFVIDVTAFGTGGSLPGVTPGGSPWDTGGGNITITGGPGVAATSFSADDSYWPAQPTSFGAFTPQRVTGTSSGSVLLDVPTSFLFAPVADPLNPVLKPSALIHLQGQEPPPGWPPTGPIGSTCKGASEWIVNSVPVIYHEAFGPLAAQTQVTSATFDFAARVVRERAALADDAERLGKRHEAAEQAVLAAEKQGKQAQQEASALTATIASLKADYDTTRAAAAKLKSVEQALAASAADLLASEASHDAVIAKLEQQILSGNLAGAALAKAQRQLTAERNGLAGVEGLLAQRFQSSSEGRLRTQLIGRLQSLERRLFAARKLQLDRLAAATAAQTELEFQRNELGLLDAQLLDIAEKLAGFNPDVVEITASVAGKEVFLSTSPVHYADLFKLDQLIAQQGPIIAQLKAARHMVTAGFLAAGKDVIASGNALAATLNRLAYARFATSLFFEAVDLGEAFLVKGGLVGLATEAAKKVAEQWTIKKLGLDKTSPQPGSIEDEINKAYAADLPAAFGPAVLINKAAEKDLKLVLFKAPKDALNAAISQLVFQKVERPFRIALEAPGYILKYGRYAGVSKLVRNLASNLDELKKGAVSRFSLKDIAKGLVKDVAKNAVKFALDEIESAAWQDYAARDLTWRGWLPLYHVTSEYYENEEEARDKLLEDKAKLLEGLSPDSSVNVISSSKFDRNATLAITLTLDGKQDPRDPLALTVGGVNATRVGNTNTYTVDAGAAVAQPDGTLKIVIS